MLSLGFFYIRHSFFLKYIEKILVNVFVFSNFI